jgi:Cofactor assembly of complex C subunit B
VNTSTLASTLFLTVLMLIGLFFFIRASTKDRIEVARLVTEQPESSLLEQLQQYFVDRAYRIVAVDATQNQVTFEGFVRPSVFLAIFLSVLAAAGTLCLSLVLSLLLPRWSQIFPGLALLSPAAGIFYWKKSARPEQVSLRIETRQLSNSKQGDRPAQSILTVTAHRDELAELQRVLRLELLESE